MKEDFLEQLININNPLEQFEIEELISISFSSTIGRYYITNSTFYLLLVLLLSFFSWYYKYKLIGNSYTILLESQYNTILSMVREQIGTEKYLPMILGIFQFILLSNLLGLIPYSFTTTSHLALTFGYSVGILIGVTIIGIKKYKLKYLSIFIPSGTPWILIPLLIFIEIISYIAKGISLAVRLSANMIAGHTLLKIISTFTWKLISSKYIIIGILYGILPIIFISLLIGLEIGIAILQSYVFCTLTCCFIKDSLYLH